MFLIFVIYRILRLSRLAEEACPLVKSCVAIVIIKVAYGHFYFVPAKGFWLNGTPYKLYFD